MPTPSHPPYTIDPYLKDALLCPIMSRQLPVRDRSAMHENGRLRQLCIEVSSVRLRESVARADGQFAHDPRLFEAARGLTKLQGVVCPPLR